MSFSHDSLARDSREGATDPPTRAPDRSRAETRRRLVTAAIELFAERGLQGTTTVQIARRAGVATGTFYLHFKDKHTLFREIAFDALDRVRERLTRRSAQAGRQPGSTPLAVVRARAEELLDFAQENRDLVRVIFGRDHEGAGLGEDLIDVTAPGIESGLRKRMAAGESAALHPGVAAQALTAMWARVLAWWVEDPRRARREEVVETLVRLHPFAAGAAH